MTYPPQQNPYGQPSPEYGDLNSGQPSYGQPAYGQPAYGQGPYDQPAYGQPLHPQAPYGQPAYPGYGFAGAPPPTRSNPVAGILLLIGVLAALGACFIPVNGGAYGTGSDMPLISTLTHLVDSIEYAASIPGGWRHVLQILALPILALGTLICLVAAMVMFAPGTKHNGAATTGLLGALLMLASPILIIVATEGLVFEQLNLTSVLMLAAWLPAMIGAMVGYSR